MQRAARHDRFDDFLADQREEERHADLVDEKPERLRKGEIGLRLDVRPDQREDGADWEQQKVLSTKLKCAGGAAPIWAVPHDDRMVSQGVVMVFHVAPV